MELKLDNILSHVSAYVAVVDKSGSIVYENREAAEKSLIADPKIDRAIREGMASGQGFKGLTVSDANGRKFTVMGDYSDLCGMVVTVVSQDIACDKCEATISNFSYIANMSHDIRTPVNAIIGFSRLMADTDDREKKRKYMEQIETNNSLLMKLINDVLDISKKKEGELEIRNSEVELNELMNSVKSTVHFRVPSRVVLNAVYGASECYVVTDPERLTQVILNLLTNACKFTTVGSITFGYEIHPEEIYFYVRDTGMGIPPEKQEFLFKRYWREHEDEPGNGLGLSICKDIVDKMNGEIGVQSAGEGKGSLFWFTLPIKPIEEEQQEATPEPVAQSAPEVKAAPVAAAPAPAQRKNRPVLLVAEDNESNYFLITSMLEDDYELIHAWNGLEAVEMYSTHKPDLILMDINMPLMDGYEATRRIRQVSDKVPIIAVTAYAFSSDRTRIMENGFSSYVSKPVNIDRLMGEIRRLL